MFIFCRKPLICNVAGWWSDDLRKKVICPSQCRIYPRETFVHYKKESDDPLLTAEVYHQRVASSDREVPFKISQSGRIMSQASGV